MAAETAVARDTQDVIKALESCIFSSTSKAATFDVEQLYPSMEPSRVKGAVKVALLAYYRANPCRGYGALIELLCWLLQIVFDGQILRMTSAVSGTKSLFVQVVGITTGLSCAVQLANLFLLGMDQTFKHTFSVQLHLYKRFVDDVLVVMGENCNTQDMLNSLNAFDDLIVCTNDGTESGTKVTFLDLDIDFSMGALSYSTHRKPLATYGYTPADSCHSKQTLMGIVSTEAIRLLRTNSSMSSFTYHCAFFASKLKLRGYDLLEVRRILAKYPWHRRSELIVPVKKIKQQVVALKLPFSPNAIQIKAASIFRSYEHLLPGRIRATFRPLVAWETSPNLFRIRYSRFC